MFFSQIGTCRYAQRVRVFTCLIQLHVIKQFSFLAFLTPVSASRQQAKSLTKNADYIMYMYLQRFIFEPCDFKEKVNSMKKRLPLKHPSQKLVDTRHAISDLSYEQNRRCLVLR